jgi:lysyl-tRNA synthetase class 2
MIQKALESFEHGLNGLPNMAGEIWVAGRIIGVLDDGFVLQDESGRMNIAHDVQINVGDIVEVLLTGEKKVSEEVIATVSFLEKEVFVLAPCVDEFYVGRSSENYKKLMIDLALKEKFLLRQKLLRGLREFFWKQGFVETETPELVRLPGMEPYLDVFETAFHPVAHEGLAPQKEQMFLITSPEYAMKKLLVSGYENIFQVTKSFRNKEHLSSLHNPEFTIVEWYRAYSDYRKIMEDTENLVYELASQANGEAVIRYKDYVVDVKPPWIRMTVVEAFEKFAGIDKKTFEDETAFKKTAAERGYAVTEETSFDDAFFLIFMNEIEPKLGVEKPVLLHEYPVSMAALSKKCDHDPKYAERVETYIAGLELSNGFTELNDPAEQQARLEYEHGERLKMGKQDYPVDQSFIRALQLGMPPSGGIALGVDRLMMLLTNTPDINQMILFPHQEL